MNVRVNDGIAPMTLVVTVFNVAPDLPALLSSISRQSIAVSELLIVDLGSTDGTLELLCGWQSPMNVTYKIIEMTSATRAVARNFAIEAASFEYVAVLDGAVDLHHEWVARMSSALDDGAQAVLGEVRPAGSTLLERTIAGIEAPPPVENDARTYSPAGGAMAFTKSSWDLVGGYPEWLEAGEDKVFAIALRQARINARIVPDAVVTWSPRQSLPGYLTESYRAAQAIGAANVLDRELIRRGLGYLLCLAGIVASRHSILTKLIVVGGLLLRLRPHFRRLWSTRDEGPEALNVRVAGTVAVVIVSDLARLVGYQRGLMASLWDADA